MIDRRKISEFIKLVEHAPDEAVRFELIELLFTPNELEQLVARMEIIRGLMLKSMTQRELAQHLSLSIAKITRGSNELKRRSGALCSYLEEFLVGEEQT